MAKITLSPVGSLIDATTAATTINANNALIATAFNNTLSRDGTTPNTLTASLDVNSQQVINLPKPTTANSPLRLQDLNTFIGGGVVGNVYSVGLALPADLTVTNSPVTATGTLTGAWATTPTGTGAMVRATSPTLVTPALGTPASGVMTNVTGLPISTGVSGLGTGVATFLTTPSSANLRTAITDESGTGALIFAGGALGAATATTINGSTISPGHYSGEPSTGSAAAGEIGEYIESVIVSGSAVALVTATAKTVTSISLTAGDWDVDALGYVLPAATTSVTNVITSISGTTNTLDITPGKINGLTFQANVSGGSSYSTTIPPYRLSLSGTTTVFLIAQATFTISTASAFGIIRARRVR